MNMNKYEEKIKEIEKINSETDQRIIKRSKKLLTAWGNGLPTEDLNAIEKDIKAHSNYERLTKIWEKKINDELLGFCYTIAGDFKDELRNWLNNPTHETFPDIEDIIDKRISQITTNTPKNVDFEKIAPLAKFSTTAFEPKQPENIAVTKLIQELKNKYKLSTLEKLLFRDLYDLDWAKKELERYTQSKSISQLAKENNVPYRRLLDTLKAINFPMIKRKSGMAPNPSNLIDKEDMRLFEGTLVIIKKYWKQKDNYSDWIRFLKGKEWLKDRISHFMNRKIKRGIVSDYYFDVVPPNERNFLNLKKMKQQRFDYPIVLKKSKVVNHKKIIKFLKDIFSGKSKYMEAF
jgi:hypothetical protein